MRQASLAWSRIPRQQLLDEHERHATGHVGGDHDRICLVAQNFDDSSTIAPVFGTLSRLRTELSELRQRVLDYDQQAPVQASPSRVVIYVGQNVTAEDDEPSE